MFILPFPMNVKYTAKETEAVCMISDMLGTIRVPFPCGEGKLLGRKWTDERSGDFSVWRNLMYVSLSRCLFIRPCCLIIFCFIPLALLTLYVDGKLQMGHSASKKIYGVPFKLHSTLLLFLDDERVKCIYRLTLCINGLFLEGSENLVVILIRISFSDLY